MYQSVILVDERDNEIGLCEKLAAHREAKLHRAFSIFVFNSRNELLMQKRAQSKYHSGGLWSNTCCSHPEPGEVLGDAIHARLLMEMGFDCPLQEVATLTYRGYLGNGLYEHELDHIFTGRYDGVPQINPAEADDWKWLSCTDLASDINLNPESYSLWLRIIVNELGATVFPTQKKF